LSPIVVDTSTATGANCTFNDLQVELYARGYDYLNQDTAGRDRAKRWLNQSYLGLCDAYPWPFLETEVTALPPVTIVDLGAVLEVRDPTTVTKLTYWEHRDLTDLSEDLTTTGTPTYWYLEDTTLKVYPVGTDAVTVRYRKVPVELAADGDPLVVPCRFLDVVVNGAVVKAYLDSDNFDAAGALQQVVDRQVQDMAAALMVRNESSTDFVQITDWEAV
jgi:hypothetical protein